MADMVARVRVVIDVPFEYDIPEATFQPVRLEEENGRAAGQEMANENQRLTARADAAKHAENQLVAALKESLAHHGTVVDELVEEVRDSDKVTT